MDYNNGDKMFVRIPSTTVDLIFKRDDGRWVLMPFTDFDVQALNNDAAGYVRVEPVT